MVIVIIIIIIITIILTESLCLLIIVALFDIDEQNGFLWTERGRECPERHKGGPSSQRGMLRLLEGRSCQRLNE